MPQATFYFPTGFLWGTATASHQVEGNNTNNNWAVWEAEAGRIRNGDRSGLACDWWGGRWKEDFDRAAETGQNAHRLSIEWSRIQPSPDRWDEHALDYYRQMVRGLRERNITPMVTLHHFSDPLWLYEQGSWENDKTPELFNSYVRKVVEALREYVSLWCTINEPNIYTLGGYADGGFPPGKNDLNLAFVVMRNLLRGHAAAYRTIHAIQPEARVGIAMHYRNLRPARPWFGPDVWISRLQSRIFNEAFPLALVNGKLDTVLRRASVPEAIKTQDFLGINYYTEDLVTFDFGQPGYLFGRRNFPPGAETSPTGFIANVPAGLSTVLKWARRFNIPLIVTENGVEDANDTLRPRYTLEHIHQVWRAVNFNWPIQGYFHWSLVDNFEWERGWSQRFGLWGLDVATQVRLRRPSVDLYAAICKENGISSDTVARFAPALLEKLFPG